MISTCFKLISVIFVIADFAPQSDGNVMPMVDFRYFRCVMKREWRCPDSEINFYLYTPEYPVNQLVDVRRTDRLLPHGWKPSRKNVLIIHGFNGTHAKTPMSYLRDAYLSRKDYNVFMVDWSPLTRFPCYLSALSNTKLAAQCTAQLYSRITQAGARARRITCVGHSLGAHVCGMMSNHLTEKQYKIIAPDPVPWERGRALMWDATCVDTLASIHVRETESKPGAAAETAEAGLDPARPLVSMYGSHLFRLGRDDAYVVQVVHTNAGFLGESGQIGHADFCVNGGRLQPGCRGHAMRIARCSHFMSSCYFAAAVRRRIKMTGVPCDATCPKEGHWGLRNDRRLVRVDDDIPESSRGMYCVRIDQELNCPFD